MEHLFFAPPPLLLDAAPGCREPVVVAGTASPLQRLPEQAGRAFQRLAIARAAAAQPVKEAARVRAASVASDGSGGVGGEEDVSEQLKLSLALQEANHYSVLGLDADATDDDIRRAYRRLILQHHPDKVGGAVDAAAEPMFLAVQKAYDVLGDDAKKRAYDSTLDFDETVPSGAEPLKTEAAFFALYGPVFARNARFSEHRPVPSLGGPGDSDGAVEGFYRFWFAFDSWRDFSGEGEHNPDSAEEREEKRWMERENARAAAKKKKAEVQRVADLVNRAYARDPRVARMKRAEEDAKQAARDAKAAAKRAAEAAAAQAEADKAATAAAAEEASKRDAAAKKAAKEREKKAGKRAEKELRRLLAESLPLLPAGGERSVTLPTDADVELLVSNRDAAGLCALLEGAAKAAAAGVAGVSSAGADGAVDASCGGSSSSSSAGSGSRALAVDGEGASSAADSSGIEPAPSSAQLWIVPIVAVSPGNAQAIARHLTSSIGAVVAEVEAARARAAEEKARASGSSSSGAAPKPDAHPWSVLELSLLSKAIAKLPPGTRNRWGAIAEFVNTVGHNAHLRSGDDCIAKARSLGEEDRRAASSAAFSTYTAMLAAKGKDAVTQSELKETDAPPPPPAAFTTGSASASSSGGGGGGGGGVSGVSSAAAAGGATSASAAAPSSGTAAPARAAVAKPAAGPAAATSAAPSSASGSAAGAPPAPAPAPAATAAVAAAPVEPDVGVWSREDQKLFEAALRTFPASLDKNERWAKVAGAVPGKTKKQCVARFKFLREQVLAAKGAPGGS